jgi:hypothetical protein
MRTVQFMPMPDADYEHMPETHVFVISSSAGADIRRYTVSCDGSPLAARAQPSLGLGLRGPPLPSAFRLVTLSSRSLGYTITPTTVTY